MASMGVPGPFFTDFAPPHPTILTPASPSRWYLTHHEGPARCHQRCSRITTGAHAPAMARLGCSYPGAWEEGRSKMKNGTFVFDAHTGVWDGSAQNCKNRFGDAFIETFYAFHTGFNPPDPHWRMDYETQFRKTDPEWYLDEMFVKGEADMAILSTQVLMDFYHQGFVTADRKQRLAAR